MFDYPLTAEIKRVEVLVPKALGPFAKVCRLTLRRDLDVDIARSIAGDFGVAALKHLHDRAITKAEFPIDSITARAAIKGKESALTIAMVTGMKAVAKANRIQDDEDPECPQVELKFQFPFSTEVWSFLGDNACTAVELTLSRNQLSLPLTAAAPPAAEAKPNGKKGRKKNGATKSSHGDDRAEAAGEIADPQDAATPEEAEEIRGQRLREREQADAGVWAEDVGAF